MPPRISRGSPPSTKPRPSIRNPRKSQKRALDAFSIASHSTTSHQKIRQHRLGESDLSSRRKRPRGEDEGPEDSEDEDATDARKRKMKKVDSGELSLDEGSDSEGNKWTMGRVNEDDDSDIDSDEAFGESDEERFEGWVFRGSVSNQKRKGKPRKSAKVVDDEDEARIEQIDLDEGESADGEEEDEDDLGEDAIDLATALDQYEDSEEERPKNKKNKKARFEESDGEHSQEEDFALDGASDLSMSDEDDDADPSKMEKLKNLISSLPTEEEAPAKGTRKVEVHESGTPSEFGVLRKVDIASFKPKVTDPDRKRSLKLLRDDLKPPKRNDIARKLNAPLPKRQQDKLDRTAATEKTNETLGRWVDTVKHNRRAEHLSFPLVHPRAGETFGESRLQPTTTEAPTNDLESTIQKILQQSGLSNGKDDEQQIQKWEELQINKLPLEEVQARRAELRKQRELLFREEVRAKRVKKIKSKAYRRVHRKERERIEQRERDALKADGVDVSEDEREYNDRRRAEERMGAKHRESKWAKGIKDSGRAAWDEDARAGVTEMARRNEELRRRIEGKEVRDEDEVGSDISSEEDENEGGDDADGAQGLQRQLGRLKQNPFATDQSKLGSMMFMQKAEAARKQRNDQEIEHLRRELAGEEGPSEDEDENAARAGRRKFGPTTNAGIPTIQSKRSEFEERPDFDEEAAYEGANDNAAQDSLDDITKATPTKSKQPQGAASPRNVVVNNPFLMKASKEKRPKKMEAGQEPDLSWKAHDTIQASQQKAKPKTKIKIKTKSSDDSLPEPEISAPDADGWQTVTYGNNTNQDQDDTESEGVDLGIVLRNQELTAKGFAGDDVEADFAAEKRAIMEDEDDKVIDNTLPGWGSWVGEGLSKWEQSKNKGRSLVKQNGIQANKRKDAKLERVIINEKKVRKNKKYLASSLPFPYETKEQYERSLRLPKGPEWTTKKTFQGATKPRVIVKQGIIRPMAKPLV
ncbi:Utp14-domain-containing protein [Lindgomyces ingoldianus]|uniref:Utp14-domain-containing protein n=1 Tax=Lindgomyces ingoldianus TaxID=673940 RepID=A0ACB6QQ18_9PLEO|nr:Utp14-domain-containing protein [Lindgomyces ingoldianus]KAF2468625.1 Utp14-domain-containing protein [Lindgomyces ingoldianus]